jgi:hypothetical protein
LKQGTEGMPVADTCRKAGISQATYFNWKAQVRRPTAEGDAAPEAARGRERQATEDGRRFEPRQRDASGRHPPKAVRPVRKRKLVDEVRGEWGVSIRRACRVFLIDTSTYHYKSRRHGQANLEQRIKEICQIRVRYGLRLVHVLLCRGELGINQKKTPRIYRELVRISHTIFA